MNNNVSFEIIKSTNKILNKGDVILGFVSDNFGNIKTELGETIDRNEFYKTTLQLQYYDHTRKIDFWTCDKFPLSNYLRPFTSVYLENKEPVYILVCYVNWRMAHYDIKKFIVKMVMYYIMEG